MTAQRIYLDHAATTPMRPEAIAAIEQGMAHWANPSSPHGEGRKARELLEAARARIAAALGWPHHVILTSGASEAIAIALGRSVATHVLLGASEHDAVFRAAPGAAVMPMNAGALDPARLATALAGGPRAVVAIQHVNSETGRIQPIDVYARVARDHDAILFCDCAQSAGKLPLPDADMIAVSAHKLGGPPGIGALLVRDLALLAPSGGQEFGYRSGTENLPGAMGFAAALEAVGPVVGANAGWVDALEPSRHALCEAVLAAGGHAIRSGVHSPLIGAYAMPGVNAASQLIQFDLAGFAVSAGSACSSGSMKPSRTLRAIGIDDDLAAQTIRVSLGWTTTPEDVARFAEAWQAVAARAPGRRS